MLHHFDAANEFHTNSPLAMSPIFRKQEFIELRDSVRVVLVLAYPWEDDSVVVQRCVMKLTGVLHHVVELVAIEHIKVIVSEIQPGVLEGIKKILDDHTMGGTLSETRMKKSILEESRKNVEDKIDLRMPKTANNMPWSATGNCTDHAELMGEHKITAIVAFIRVIVVSHRSRTTSGSRDNGVMVGSGTQ